MANAVKTFFEKTWVRVTEIVVMILCIVGLLYGGITSDDIKSVVDYTAAGVIAVTAVITLVKTIASKENA
jgi:thiamine monophosphate synthase